MGVAGTGDGIGHAIGGEPWVLHRGTETRPKRTRKRAAVFLQYPGICTRRNNNSKVTLIYSNSRRTFKSNGTLLQGRRKKGIEKREGATAAAAAAGGGLGVT